MVNSTSNVCSRLRDRITPPASSSHSKEEHFPVNSIPTNRLSFQCNLPLDKVQSVLTGIKSITKASSKTVKYLKQKILCLYCDRTFVNSILKKKHIEHCHANGRNQRISLRRKSTLNLTNTLCSCIERDGQDLESLFKHLIELHSDKYFACFECQLRFETFEQLGQHLDLYHKSAIKLLSSSLPDVSPTKMTYSNLKENRKNKMATLTVKRSKRLQNKMVKVEKSPKTPKQFVEKKPNCFKNHSTYPLFEVQKITDHSIDNLKIKSLTFEDVFDKSFFTRIKCNIRENLLNYIDGKLTNNEQSQRSEVNLDQDQYNLGNKKLALAENHVCELPMKTVTPAVIPLQLGGSEVSVPQTDQVPRVRKKLMKTDQKAIQKDDLLSCKYLTRKKYQAYVWESRENTDLTKLDMWTQFVVNKRQRKVDALQKTSHYNGRGEYESQIQKDELDRILDRRGPFEDLRGAVKEPSRTVDTDDEVLTYVGTLLQNIVEKIDSTVDATAEQEFKMPPPHLGLVPYSEKHGGAHEILDKSDRISLICSSQDTEDFEVATNERCPEDDKVELSGEWARSRIYVCAACGLKLPNVKLFLDHKTTHQNVWVQHYEFVGNQSELCGDLCIPVLGMMKDLMDQKNGDPKNWLKSNDRKCTKCKKNCSTLGEFHRHILECGGDWTWMLVRKKYKYRPYGTKSRRRRRGLINRIYSQKLEVLPSKKRGDRKISDARRQKPSDAETIQKMLANLPAKRCTRKLLPVETRKRTTKSTEVPKSNSRNIVKVLRKKTSTNVNNKTNNQLGIQQRRSPRNSNKVTARCLSDKIASKLVRRNIYNGRNRSARNNNKNEKSNPPITKQERKDKVVRNEKEITMKRQYNPRNTEITNFFQIQKKRKIGDNKATAKKQRLQNSVVQTENAVATPKVDSEVEMDPFENENVSADEIATENSLDVDEQLQHIPETRSKKTQRENTIKCESGATEKEIVCDNHLTENEPFHSVVCSDSINEPEVKKPENVNGMLNANVTKVEIKRNKGRGLNECITMLTDKLCEYTKRKSSGPKIILKVPIINQSSIFKYLENGSIDNVTSGDVGHSERENLITSESISDIEYVKKVSQISENELTAEPRKNVDEILQHVHDHLDDGGHAITESADLEAEAMNNSVTKTDDHEAMNDENKIETKQSSNSFFLPVESDASNRMDDLKKDSHHERNDEPKNDLYSNLTNHYTNSPKETSKRDEQIGMHESLSSSTLFKDEVVINNLEKTCSGILDNFQNTTPIKDDNETSSSVISSDKQLDESTFGIFLNGDHNAKIKDTLCKRSSEERTLTKRAKSSKKEKRSPLSVKNTERASPYNETTLRRSSRSRKVTSYNETNIVDVVLEDLDRIEKIKRLSIEECKKPPELTCPSKINDREDFKEKKTIHGRNRHLGVMRELILPERSINNKHEILGSNLENKLADATIKNRKVFNLNLPQLKKCDIIDLSHGECEKPGNSSSGNNKKEHTIDTDGCTREHMKVNSDELFDLLKAKPCENIVFAHPPTNSFWCNFDADNCDDNDFDSSIFDRSLTASNESVNKNHLAGRLSNKCDVADKTNVAVMNPNSKCDVFTDVAKEISDSVDQKENSVNLNDRNRRKSIPTEKAHCEICNKSFARPEGLTKHRKTIKHISKLSAIEANVEQENNDLIDDKQDSNGIGSDVNALEIIENVIEKPNGLITTAEVHHQKLPMMTYRSLGERKIFDSEVPELRSESAGEILEKQIHLLENIIDPHSEHLKPKHGSITRASDDSGDLSKICNSTETGKFTRKVLNRDEELFLECCSLLKSSSDIMSSSEKGRIEEFQNKDDSLTRKNINFKFAESSVTKSSQIDFLAVDSQSFSSVYLDDGSLMDDAKASSDSNSKHLNFNNVLSTHAQRIDDTMSISSDDEKGVITKGALKVFEGIKVSIPTTDITIPSSSKHKANATVSSSNERQDVGSPKDDFLAPILTSSSCQHSPDIYDFEETQDNTDVIVLPKFSRFRTYSTKIEDDSLNQNFNDDHLTKTKCMIMGRIFKNSAIKTKLDDHIRNIPHEEKSTRVERFVLNCHRSIIYKENEASMLSRKNKKRTGSSDDEFIINRISSKKSKRGRRKNCDNSINIEQEIRECIGVASRKSQRKCTSGKQNVLIEYWSSDESLQEQSPPTIAISALNQRAEDDESLENKPVSEQNAKSTKWNEEPVTNTEPLQTSVFDESSIEMSRRKRSYPLYHWSSSSDEIDTTDSVQFRTARDRHSDLNCEDERPAQHGWIVGDSPKKLVTMLAQAKGRKTV